MSDDELTSRLERLAGSVRSTDAAVPQVLAEVRRRQGRRRAFAVVGGVAAVGLVVGAVLGGSAWLGGAPGPRPVADPPPSPTGNPSSTGIGEELFRCQRGLQPYADPPPIDDLADQQAIVDSLPDTRKISAWGLVRAEPTPLGVVALVVNAQFAEPPLTALGVSHVREWDPSGPEVGLDEHAQVEQVIGWQLDPVLREVRRETGGIPGSAGLAYWHEAGAVVVQWKTPVPPEVEALAGERANGVRVEVWPADYSAGDVRRAQADLQAWLEQSGNRDRWTSSYGCSDGAGLVVGIAPPLEDRAELQRLITEAVGMPTMVVAEEHPVDRAW